MLLLAAKNRIVRNKSLKSLFGARKLDSETARNQSFLLGPLCLGWESLVVTQMQKYRESLLQSRQKDTPPSEKAGSARKEPPPSAHLGVFLCTQKLALGFREGQQSPLPYGDRVCAW